MWIGHSSFGRVRGDCLRHAALGTGEGEGLSIGGEAIAEAAIEECERFYPVFQFVLWGGKSPSEAISAALIETVGEA